MKKAYDYMIIIRDGSNWWFYGADTSKHNANELALELKDGGQDAAVIPYGEWQEWGVKNVPEA